MSQLERARNGNSLSMKRVSVSSEAGQNGEQSCHQGQSSDSQYYQSPSPKQAASIPILPRNEELQNTRSPQSRRLQLRNSRFRGPALAGSLPASSIPVPLSASNTIRPFRRKQAYPSLDGQFSEGEEEEEDRQSLDEGYENEAGPSSSSPLSSPSLDRLKMPRRSSTFNDSTEPGVLQEISNSSLRRQRRLASRPDELAGARLGSNNENLARKESPSVKPWDMDRSASSPASPQSTGSRNGFRSLRMLSRSGKSAIPRRSVSGGTSRYIEDLESQLASAQTQLQSLTSPTATSSQSAKFRAVNGELRVLRQELADWETKFEQRVQEQVEHHDHVTAALNIQIRALEKEKESSGIRIRELEMDNEEKSAQLLSVEGANYDLERRLEFMSELIATSPVRERTPLHQDCFEAPAQQSRPSTSSRSRSAAGFQRLSLVTVGQRICRPNNPSSLERDMRSALGSPQPRERPLSFHGDPFSLAAPGSERSACSSTEKESELSEGPTLVEDSTSMPDPYNRRNSLTHHYHTTDDETKKRLPRRMRRFYTGANGPKSLILPVTTNTQSFPLSAPVSSTQTPALPARSSFHASQHVRFGSRDMQRRSHSILHKRSATWDHDASLVSPHSSECGENNDFNILASPLTYAVDETPERDSIEAVIPDITSSNFVKESTAEDRDGNAPTESPAAAGNLLDELRRMDMSNDSNANTTVGNQEDGRPREMTDALGDSRPRTAINTTVITSPVASRTIANSEKGRMGESADAKSELFSTSVSSTATAKPGEVGAVTVLYNGRARSEGLLCEQGRRLVFPRNFSPSTILTNLLNVVSSSLNSQHPIAGRIMTNAWTWSLSSLCWPVVCFRWWLVRLLLGDLWKRRNERQPEGARSNYSILRGLLNGSSPRPEMIVLMPGTIRKLGLMTIFEDETSPNSFAAGHQRHISVASEDEYDLYLDGKEEEDTILAPSQALAASGDKSSCAPGRLNDGQAANGSEARSTQVGRGTLTAGQETKVPVAPPVTWLKFSLALCFAVGIAIKDGPATLFKT